MSDKLPENTLVLVPVKAFEKVANYLLSRPYQEVSGLIPLLQNLKTQEEAPEANMKETALEHKLSEGEASAITKG